MDMSEPSSSLDAPVDHKLPRHIAIIMDGNSRWAKQKRFPSLAGHKAGVDAVRAVVRACAEKGVEVLTLFAFSSENWRRPEQEVKGLMALFVEALKRQTKRLHENNIRLRVIGDLSLFDVKLQSMIADAEDLTKDNTGLTVAIAANYGGHWDITEAAKVLARKVASNQLSPDDITAELMQQHVCLGDLPPPDLCIRTSGEQRISNFLLWQLAYAEFYFTDAYWPDFKEAEFDKALENYAQRKRRFGRTDEQVESSDQYSNEKNNE